MQEKGLEPSLLIQKADFESAASADSAIPAYGLWCGTSTCSRIFVILSDLPKNNNLGFLCQISANSRNRVRTKAMAETYLGASVPFQIFPRSTTCSSMMARNSSAVSLLPPRIQAVAWRSQTSNVWQVSCFCPMPAVTKEMIQWWLWWHPQENLRYKA